jgi:hypothetical protein
VALGRGGERLGELRERCGIGRRQRLGEQDRIAAAGAMGDDIRDPGRERSRIGDVAGLDRPLESVGIAVGTDRVAGREPGGEDPFPW